MFPKFPIAPHFIPFFCPKFNSCNLYKQPKRKTPIYRSTLGWFGNKVPNNELIFVNYVQQKKLHFNIILNNEDIVFEIFIFGMASTHFSQFLTIPRNN
jgi:hypothetical protein